MTWSFPFPFHRARALFAVAALLATVPGVDRPAGAQAVWGTDGDSYRIHNRVAPDSCVVDDREAVVRYREEPVGVPPSVCEPSRNADAVAVKAVVKAYWAASSARQYEMFSSGYQDMLRKVHDVPGPEDYAKRIDPERIYVRQDYQQVELGGGNARVTVLATWTQEGYEGLQTFIFELVREGDAWKIRDLYY